MKQHSDVIIVGGGVTGLSTALHLKEIGVKDVLILERHYIGSGQSGRAAGVIRGTVSDPTVSETQLEGQAFFQAFEERFSIPIDVNHIGYILVGKASLLGHIEDTIKVARSAGCDLKQIDAEEAEELQPGLGTEDDAVFVYEPGGLYVDPMSATYALSLAAKKSGVRIVEGCEVGDIRVNEDKVSGVKTASGDFNAPKILIATSVWGQPQLAKLGINVPVRPHIAEMGFFQVGPGSKDKFRRIIFDSRANLYMRPEGDRQLFVGRREDLYYQKYGNPIDPDSYKQTANFHSIDEMHKNLLITLPFMKEGFVHRTYACTYDVTPDQMPILDKAETIEGLYYAIGFSGGGFSTSPWVGKRMAAFIAKDTYPQDLEVFRFKRFAQGKTIKWANTPIDYN
jgi:sarcosine oxidase subunit beta